MTIVFDMDNTLVDEFGAGTRPGIVKVLEKLNADGYRLAIWTNSRRVRAREILQLHDLGRHFAAVVCREDYDPRNEDIRKKGFLITPFRKGGKASNRELQELYAFIRRTG